MPYVKYAIIAAVSLVLAACSGGSSPYGGGASGAPAGTKAPLATPTNVPMKTDDYGGYGY